MESVRQTSAVTFDIMLNENAVKPEPKRMVLIKNRQTKKEPLTADEIEKRQKLAEDRRMARLEARLKRMHEREESTRKLACSVDILLQQQALWQGQVESPDNVSLMSQKQVRETAIDVFKGFNEMRQQLLNTDLRVDEGGQLNSYLQETKWQKALKSTKMSTNTQKDTTKNPKPSQIPVKKPLSDVSSEMCEQKHEGIAFEIPFESSTKCKKKPAIARVPKDLRRENREMVALKLEEKQRIAAERRQKKQDDRIRKTRESRESLMELQSKVNIFRQHQAARDGKADPDLMLSKHEAACLAHEIADGFGTMHGRYEKDLERAKGFRMVYDKVMS